MLKIKLLVLFYVPFLLQAQSVIFPDHLKNSYISKIKNNDSLIFYQCHVDTVKQELTTSLGQKIISKNKKITITQKFVITLIDSIYHCRHYASSITDYPNKKFPYLTLKETKSWDFELKQSKQLQPSELLLLAAFETKTHDIVHYELTVNKSTRNEIVIHYKKEKKQLIVEGDYIISKLLNL